MSSAARTSLPHPLWRNVLTALADETGTIAAEYGLIAALVALAIIGSIMQLGESIAGLPIQSLVDAFMAALS